MIRATPSERTIDDSEPNYQLDLEKDGFDMDKYKKSRP